MAPFLDNVIAGGSAGIVEILMMYPTDVVKTRTQLATGSSRSLPVLLRSMVQREGALVFYRGISAPIVSEAPKRAVKFSTNELYRGMMVDAQGQISALGYLAAGACAGATEAFVNCPFEVVKVRMQAADSKAFYNSTGDAAKKILLTEGPQALYKGIEAQLIRNAVWNGLYFCITPLLQRRLGADRGSMGAMVPGMVAGIIATTCSTPFDVVKSRMQNQKGGVVKYAWAVPSLLTILREEGVRSIYKGLSMRLLRLGPGGGIMAVTFDFIQGKLQLWRQRVPSPHLA
eukprot:GGOE01004530.1.p1 GENE.GGOE01004530.1~~GGOE01004530.1.p1  ORF type:complete len:299 (-),score=90.32 GGOE01004530.1:37-897(-)